MKEDRERTLSGFVVSEEKDKYLPSFSVDTNSDLKLVNKLILKDSLLQKY